MIISSRRQNLFDEKTWLMITTNLLCDIGLNLARVYFPVVENRMTELDDF